MSLNAFERRQAESKKKYAVKRKKLAEDRIVDRDSWMLRYEQAFRELHGKAVKVTYTMNRFNVSGDRLTRSMFEAKTNLLEAHVHTKRVKESCNAP